MLVEPIVTVSRLLALLLQDYDQGHRKGTRVIVPRVYMVMILRPYSLSECEDTTERERLKFLRHRLGREPLEKSPSLQLHIVDYIVVWLADLLVFVWFGRGKEKCWWNVQGTKGRWGLVTTLSHGHSLSLTSSLSTSAIGLVVLLHDQRLQDIS